MHKLLKNRSSTVENDWSTGRNKTRGLILTAMDSQQPVWSLCCSKSNPRSEKNKKQPNYFALAHVYIQTSLLASIKGRWGAHSPSKTAIGPRRWKKGSQILWHLLIFHDLCLCSSLLTELSHCRFKTGTPPPRSTAGPQSRKKLLLLYTSSLSFILLSFSYLTPISFSRISLGSNWYKSRKKYNWMYLNDFANFSLVTILINGNYKQGRLAWWGSPHCQLWEPAQTWSKARGFSVTPWGP